MMSTDLKAKLAGARPELLSFIVQESDKRVAAQVQLALATDSRSIGLMAVSVTLASAGMALAGSQLEKQGLSPLVLGASSAALLAVSAAVCAVAALWPRSLDVHGWSPRFFLTDLEKDFTVVQAEIAAKNEEKIVANVDLNACVARWVRRAMVCLVLAPVIGGAVAAARNWLF